MIFADAVQIGHAPGSIVSASAFSSQNRMSISRYIAVAVVSRPLLPRPRQALPGKPERAEEQAHPEPPSMPQRLAQALLRVGSRPVMHVGFANHTQGVCLLAPLTALFGGRERSFRPPPRRPVVSPVRAAPSPLRGRRPRRCARRSPTPPPAAPAPGHRRRGGRVLDASGPRPPASAPRPARTCTGG